MPAKNAKPTQVPTLHAARTALWCLVYLLAFGVLYWVYTTHGKLEAARAQLHEARPTPVATPLFKAQIPAGWAEYAVSGTEVTARRKKGQGLPVLHISAERDAAYAYRALDLNQAVVLRVLDDMIARENIAELKGDTVLEGIGSERIVVMPGIDAMHLLFDCQAYEGEALLFFAGEVRYVIWGIWQDGDLTIRREIGGFIRRLFEEFEIPEMREAIDRPVMHSGQLSPEVNAAAYEQIGRELALWKLFAARAEREPDTALLPALQHFREALRLLASIRQERMVLASDDFKLYEKLLKERRKDVDEWFVILDKLVAMRDWEKARRQAKWIQKHATLTGERIDVRRATEILNTKIPAEEK